MYPVGSSKLTVPHFASLQPPLNWSALPADTGGADIIRGAGSGTLQEPAKKQQAPAYHCRSCASLLLQPTEWVHVDEQRWQVSMRCPECYEAYDVVLEQDEVNEFSYHLEHGFQCLLEAVDQLDQEAFETECETFIAAVRADGVYPMDF